MAAFIGRVTVVIYVIPVVEDWCSVNRRDPRAFYLPLAYAANIGSSLTLLGGSTNVIMADKLFEETGEVLSIVSMAPFFILPVLVTTLALAVRTPVFFPEQDQSAVLGAQEHLLVNPVLEPTEVLDNRSVYSRATVASKTSISIHADVQRRGNTIVIIDPAEDGIVGLAHTIPSHYSQLSSHRV